MSELDFVAEHLQPGWDADVVLRLEYLKKIEQGPTMVEPSSASRLTPLPDTMVDSRLYGNRLKCKLVDTFASYYKPAEVLFDRITQPLHSAEFGKALHEGNLNCRLTCGTVMNIHDAAESGELRNGKELSPEECQILWGFIDLVSHACYAEDRSGKKEWQDPFDHQAELNDRAFDRFLSSNMAKLIHCAPTFNPIREANSIGEHSTSGTAA
mmetsp:Transcript_23899/g.68036  ORF Transcript_23899/g.68036 Transcript_23899/m.68036 type:complete len:211 (+) Transcript_23899:115-747(+)